MALPFTKPEIYVDTRFSPKIGSAGIESAVVYAPFDEALEVLAENGYDFISTAQNAQLRRQMGQDTEISIKGNLTGGGVIYFPKGKPKLVRNSPIILSAEKATQAHSKGSEFYPTREQIEQALEDSVDFPQESIVIPTNRFGSEDLTVHAFGGEEQAGAYGRFLRKVGLKKMSIRAVDRNYVDKQNQPFARQTWFGGLDHWSDLNSSMYISCRLRGVK